MKEFIQAANFYRTLDDEERRDLAQSVAASIFFLDDALQREVIMFFKKADSGLAEEIAAINSFTI